MLLLFGHCDSAGLRIPGVRVSRLCGQGGNIDKVRSNLTVVTARLHRNSRARMKVSKKQK